jgi:hypothetical protein
VMAATGGRATRLTTSKGMDGEADWQRLSVRPLPASGKPRATANQRRRNHGRCTASR